MGCEVLVPLLTLTLPHTISTPSAYIMGPQLPSIAPAAPVSAIWTTANNATLYPITLPSKYTVRFFRWPVGSVTSGNYDIGIYDGNFSLLRSLGSTAWPAALSFANLPITPLTLQPGRYWLAFVADNIVGQLFMYVPLFTLHTRLIGTTGQNAAFPLPATITESGNVNFKIPLIAIADSQF